MRIGLNLFSLCFALFIVSAIPTLAWSQTTSFLYASSYGVKCDNSTDNASTIAAALAAAATVIGGSTGTNGTDLIMPAGVCLTSATIVNNYNGVVMVGASPANFYDSLKFLGTTIRLINPTSGSNAGGTVMAIGPVSISSGSWTVDFSGVGNLTGQGLVGVTLDGNNLATRGLYIANTTNILVDTAVTIPVNYTTGGKTYYATAVEVDGNVNRGSISASWTEATSAGSGGSAGIQSQGTYPALFANQSNTYNYALPAAPYPIGLWIHTPFTYSGSPATTGNSSYVRFPVITVIDQNYGVPIQVDGADHETFGVINGYGVSSSTNTGGAGMVINNSIQMLATGTTSGDTPAGSTQMTLSSTTVVNPYGVVELVAGGTALNSSNQCNFQGFASSPANTLKLNCTTHADIPSGTSIYYSWSQQPPYFGTGSTTVGEYSLGAPMYVAGSTGSMTAPSTFQPAPQGITVRKMDTGNGVPSPVLGTGAYMDWEDDESVTHQLMAINIGLGPNQFNVPQVNLTGTSGALNLNGAGLALGSPLVTETTNSNGLNLNGAGLTMGSSLVMYNGTTKEVTLYGETSGNLNYGNSGLSSVGTGSCSILSGRGTPNGVVTAPTCSLYLNANGGTGTTLYVKESGSGNTGWTGK